MRTLKKTLCLVLALVMMLGLCAINVSAAGYTDDASVGADYREAIEVLTGIGVFNGKDDGSLGPQDALTRVQGCYLICKLLGAPNGAGFASFTDVSAQDSPVVAYCQTLGIVEGYGDNTFHPYDPLTGAAFAKMCLVALGYNAAVEGMTGYNWVSGTQHLTTVAALADGIPNYTATTNLSREQAAQICLNTLKATMVEYEGNVSVSGSDGLNVTVNGYRYNLANKSGVDYRTNPTYYYSGDYRYGGADTMEFVEMYFPQLKLDNDTANVDKDNLYAPLKHIWNYRGSELYRTLATPVLTYTGKMDKSAVSADMSNYYIVRSNGDKMYINNATTYPGAEGTSGTTTVTSPSGTYFQMNGIYAASGDYMFMDGTINAARISTTGTLEFLAPTPRTLANVISDITANGRKVDFYATDDDQPNRITNVVVTGYTVAKIRTVSTSGTTTSYTFTAAQSANSVNFGTKRIYGDAPADSTLITDATLAQNDYVTITYPGCDTNPVNAPKVYVYATEMFTGVQTTRNSNNYVIVDGSTYNVATGVAKDSVYTSLLNTGANSDDFSNSNGTSNFFVDQYGYLVHSDAVSNGNYAFIVGASGKIVTDVDGKTPEITVRAVLSDGTVGSYKVATEKVKYSDLDPVLYSLNSNNYSTGVFSLNEADVESHDLYLIKNTKILVGIGGNVTGYFGSDTKNSWHDDIDTATELQSTADKNAKILMGEAYGYVYNYSLNAAGDTITLTPVNRNAEGSTAYRFDENPNDPDAYRATYTPGTVYTGETNKKNAIVKSQASYSSIRGQSADGKSGLMNRLGVGPVEERASTGSVLLNAGTPIVVYNSRNRTASVVDGLGNMPTNTGESRFGYFVGTYNENGSFTARTIFIAKEGGVSASTKEYLFVKTTEYNIVEEDGTDVYYYRAWHEDGSSDNFYVKDDADDEKVDFRNERGWGLYTANANNVITEAVLYDYGDAPGDHQVSGPEPYAYVSVEDEDVGLPVENGMIKVNTLEGESWYYLDNAVYVYPNGEKSFEEADGAYIVLEVDGGSLTANVKTIYVI